VVSLFPIPSCHTFSPVPLSLSLTAGENLATAFS
jgi:hypothetical protein